MVERLNLHELLGSSKGYLRAINVPDDDAETLRQAREEIRHAIRGAFANPEIYIRKNDLFINNAAIPTRDLELKKPKFRLQGSFKYETANDCQINPPQEIDQDDGMFLPVGFFRSKAGVTPLIASDSYFALVERAIEPLAQKRGWTINYEKDTCIRVHISNRLHLDIPLYVIEDGAFETLVNDEVRKRFQDEASVKQELELADTIYRNIAEDQILLAHRTEKWIESDPRKIEIWFENSVSTFGTILRRLSRIFKGMRDANNMDDQIGSICIMAAIVDAAKTVKPYSPNREDLAIRDYATELSRLFGNYIYNPAFPGDSEKRLCKRWDDETRHNIQELFKNAGQILNSAICGTSDRQEALKLTQSVFGHRVPNDISLIKLVGQAETIRQQEPAPQPKPLVPRTRSG